MRLTLDFLPGTDALLNRHEQVGQQPDNLCGPYWLSLFLQVYGKLAVSAVDVAEAAATILPNQGNPSDWLPPGATSRTGTGYNNIPTASDLSKCGTSVEGLIQTAENMSQGRLCLLPVQTQKWESGLDTLARMCTSGELGEWVVPLLNIHTSYLWGSRLSPAVAMRFLQNSEQPAAAPDWHVGHFCLLIGQVQGTAQKLYAILDTYPQFGWNGLHLQPRSAIAQSLHRPQQSTQGGILLFTQSKNSAQVKSMLLQEGFQMGPWDNGTPFCPP